MIRLCIPVLSSVGMTGGVKNVVIGENNAHVHAEINAFKRLNGRKFIGKQRLKIDILILRVNSRGELGNSQPCFHCITYMMKHLYRYKIRYVYYSIKGGGLVCVRFNGLERNTSTVSRGRCTS